MVETPPPPGASTLPSVAPIGEGEAALEDQAVAMERAADSAAGDAVLGM